MSELESLSEGGLLDTDEMVENALIEFGKRRASELRRDSTAIRREHRGHHRQTRVSTVFRRPLERFELIVAVCEAIGLRCAEDESRGVPNSRSRDVLLRLHSRGCQTAAEVVILLRAGMISAAASRGRTLHELLVVADIVDNFGEEVAERYWHHHIFHTARDIETLVAHGDEIGAIAPLAAEREAVQRELARLVERFGPEYASDYGWAAAVAGRKRPSFADLEKLAGRDAHRPFYRFASHSTHAGSAALEMGKPDNWEPIRTELYRSPAMGIVLPGFVAALTLKSLTVQLLHAVTTPSEVGRALVVDLNLEYEALCRLYTDLGRLVERADRSLSDY